MLVGAAVVPDGTRGDGRYRRGATAAWSVERRCVNLRRPMPTVRTAWGRAFLPAWSLGDRLVTQSIAIASCHHCALQALDMSSQGVAPPVRIGLRVNPWIHD